MAAKKKSNNKVKENDIKVLLLALGVAAVACSHTMVNEPLTLEIEQLNSSITAQTAEKERLIKVKAEEDIMRLEIDDNQKIIENELLKYPGDILIEDYIMYADTLRNQLDIELMGVAISNPSQLQKLDITRRVAEEDKEMSIASFLTTLSFSWEFSYEGLKSFIEYVHADKERTVVNNVSIAYNAGTGMLSGGTVINKYFIATPDYVYTPPDLPLTQTGNDNPFGTIR